MAVGGGVDRARIGERVWVCRADHRAGMGAAAEFVAVPADCAVVLPDDVPFAAGASLGVPALTATMAVFTGGPSAGSTCWCRAAPARSRATRSSSRGRTARACSRPSARPKRPRTRGATAPTRSSTIERKTSRRACWHLTGGRGVARIVEVDFGANLAADVAMIAPHGVIASYSSSRVREPVLPYYDLAPKDVTLRIVQGKIIPDATRLAGVALITQLMQSGTLIHPPALSYPFGHMRGRACGA